MEKMMEQCLQRYGEIFQSKNFIYNWKCKRTENVPPYMIFLKNHLNCIQNN